MGSSLARHATLEGKARLKNARCVMIGANLARALDGDFDLGREISLWVEVQLEALARQPSLLLRCAPQQPLDVARAFGQNADHSKRW
jgi:hypothetical protein